MWNVLGNILIVKSSCWKFILYLNFGCIGAGYKYNGVIVRYNDRQGWVFVGPIDVLDWIKVSTICLIGQLALQICDFSQLDDRIELYQIKFFNHSIGSVMSQTDQWISNQSFVSTCLGKWGDMEVAENKLTWLAIIEQIEDMVGQATGVATCG